MLNVDTQALGEIRLPESSGEEVRIGDLWATGPAVVGWLRHYG